MHVTYSLQLHNPRCWWSLNPDSRGRAWMTCVLAYVPWPQKPYRQRERHKHFCTFINPWLFRERHPKSQHKGPALQKQMLLPGAWIEAATYHCQALRHSQLPYDINKIKSRISKSLVLAFMNFECACSLFEMRMRICDYSEKAEFLEESSAV